MNTVNARNAKSEGERLATKASVSILLSQGKRVRVLAGKDIGWWRARLDPKLRGFWDVKE